MAMVVMNRVDVFTDNAVQMLAMPWKVVRVIQDIKVLTVQNLTMPVVRRILNNSSTILNDKH
jgi:hypothetical protein